jgi:hypothetical protein
MAWHASAAMCLRHSYREVELNQRLGRMSGSSSKGKYPKCIIVLLVTGFETSSVCVDYLLLGASTHTDSIRHC